LISNASCDEPTPRCNEGESKLSFDIVANVGFKFVAGSIISGLLVTGAA
jgi:hypothetical protein